jgi:hypothetical protein
VFQLALRLIDMFFERPTNSFLHRRIQSLFSKIAQNQARLRTFCAESGICRRIVDMFRRRDDAAAAYWGVLYAIANVIAEKAPGEQDDEEWASFMDTTMKEMKTLIEEPFGGPRPNQDDLPLETDEPFPVGRSQIQAKLPDTVTTFNRGRDDEDDDLID